MKSPTTLTMTLKVVANEGMAAASAPDEPADAGTPGIWPVDPSKAVTSGATEVVVTTPAKH